MPARRPLVSFEGGAVSLAERDGRFYIVQDGSTMAGLLDEDDLVGLADPLQKMWEFDSASERDSYLRNVGGCSRLPGRATCPIAGANRSLPPGLVGV